MMNILVALFLAFSVPVAQSDTLPVKIKFLGSYWKNGKVGSQLWHNILVPEKIKKDELITVAKVLFKDKPGYYRIFTDDKEFQAFIDCDLHYMDEQHDSYPYPEKWANKHYFAMINHYNRFGEWALWPLSTSALKIAGNDSVITMLGKPEKPIR